MNQTSWVVGLLGIALCVVNGASPVQAQSSLHIYVDVGTTMGHTLYIFGRPMDKEVANALRPFIQDIITGDDEWTPLPQNTVIHVYAFRTKKGQPTTERRLAHTINPEHRYPSYRTLANFGGIGGGDAASRVNALVSGLPADPRTVIIILSNSPRLNQAMSSSPTNVIIANLPKKGAKNMGSAIQDELSKALLATRERMSNRRLITWTVAPQKGKDEVIFGQKMLFNLEIKNGMRWAVSNVNFKIHSVEGTTSFKAGEGRIARLDHGEKKVVQLAFTATKTTPPGVDDYVSVNFKPYLMPRSYTRHLDEGERQLRLRGLTPEQPIARFSPEHSSGAAPLTVKFGNESEKANRFQWSFGDGTISEELDPPSHVYRKIGSYDVSLTAISDSGAINMIGITNAVVVVDQVEPTADFEYTTDPPTAIAPCTVEFSNLSQNAVTYSWNFGNESNSTDANPKTTYTVAGAYTVRLVAAARDGQTHEFEKLVEVNDPAPPIDEPAQPKPIAKLTIMTPVKVGKPLQIKNQSRNAAEFQWEFGGEPNSTRSYQKKPVGIMYEKRGTYQVVLTAWSTNRTHRNVREDSEAKTVRVTGGCGGGPLLMLLFLLAAVFLLVKLLGGLGMPPLSIVYRRNGVPVDSPSTTRRNLSLKDRFGCSQDLRVRPVRHPNSDELCVKFSSRGAEASLENVESQNPCTVDVDGESEPLPLGTYVIRSANNDEVEIQDAKAIKKSRGETGDNS